MSSTSSIELQRLGTYQGQAQNSVDFITTHPSAVEDDSLERQQEFSLPPVDKGKDAWLFLFASFFTEALVWGFPFSFGVFQDYYHSHEPFAGSSGIATIGTCAMGIMYFAFPIAVALQRLYPRLVRWAPSFGIVSLCASLILSSFSQNVTHLILTQGILYAIAASFAYCPCMAWLEEWFVQRRGLAFGVMWSGTGTGGIAIPLVLESLLQKYGFRTTLRIWAVCLLVLSTPAFFFVKPRIPASSTGSGRLRINLAFVYDRTFVLYQVANIVESLGYFLPTIYLPHYARSVLQASPFLAAFTVLLINVSNAAGIFLMGILADKWHITTCILISTVGAVLATFFLWGFAGQLAILYVFCVVYGLFAGSYVGTWPGVSRQVVSNRTGHEFSPNGRSFDPTMVTGFLIAGRGIGNIVSGPLSEALLKACTTQDQSTRTWGLGGYGAVIIFTGVTALGGGSSYIWKKLGWLL